MSISTSLRRLISRCDIFADGSSPPALRSAPYLDNPSSYTVAVDTGEVAVDLDSLNAIVTRALERARSNVRRIEISVDEQGTASTEGRGQEGHQRTVRHEGERRRHA